MHNMPARQGSPTYKAGESWRGKITNGHEQASTRRPNASPSKTRPSSRLGSPSRAKEVNDFMGWDATDAGPDERKAPMPFKPTGKVSVVPTTEAMRQRVLREVFGLIDDDCSGHLDTTVRAELSAYCSLYIESKSSHILGVLEGYHCLWSPLSPHIYPPLSLKLDVAQELLSLGEAMGQTPRETEVTPIPPGSERHGIVAPRTEAEPQIDRGIRTDSACHVLFAHAEMVC